MPGYPTGVGPGGITDEAKVVRFAEAQLGKPYVLGGAGPEQWDCSGLTMQAYAQVGISLPHHAALQMVGSTMMQRSELQPGDLLFPSTLGVVIGDHVQMYVGNDTLIEAPDKTIPVREVPLSHWYGNASTVRARRILGTVNPGNKVGDVSSASDPGNVFSQAAQALSAVNTFEGVVSNPDVWRRVGKFALGFGLTALAVVVLVSRSEVGQQIKSAAKGAASTAAETAAVAA